MSLAILYPVWKRVRRPARAGVEHFLDAALEVEFGFTLRSAVRWGVQTRKPILAGNPCGVCVRLGGGYLIGVLGSGD